MSIIDRLFRTLRKNDDFLCALATVGKDGNPRVRYMKGVIRDDLSILCPTFASTQKVRDIERCSAVSLTCGDTTAAAPGSYFQIAAQATLSTAPVDRAAAWTDRLAKWFSGPEDEDYVVIVIVPDRIVALPIGGGQQAEAWERSESAI
jgi:general stress protein 26